MNPVSIRDLAKWYGEIAGLNKVNLELQPGIIGLVGPNGAGKSTLMKILTGQLKPSYGEALIFGKDVWKTAAVRRRLGYSPEGDSFYEDMSVLAFVRAMGRLCGLGGSADAFAREALGKTGALEYAGKRLKACSKGMRQRAKLAQALVHKPDILVLDEPLNGIDATGRREMLRLFEELAAAGATVIVSSHILEEIEAVTSRIVFLAQGKVIASGALAEVRGLLKDHPLKLLVTASEPRKLGARLLESGLVTGIVFQRRGGELAEDDLVLSVPQVESFYRALPGLVRELGISIERLVPLDASAEAVFGYLVGEEMGGGP
jgi:ABC-2 type transport system ATP-binding protein